MGKDCVVTSEGEYRKKVGNDSNNTAVTGKVSGPRVSGKWITKDRWLLLARACEAE